MNSLIKKAPQPNNHFTAILVSLTNGNVSGGKLQLLANVIDYLLLQMEDGHSCINLNEYVLDNSSSVEIIRILETSDLCGFYVFGQAIKLKPLTVLHINKDTCLLYLTRYFYYELSCVSNIKLLNTQSSLLYNEIDEHVKKPLSREILFGKLRKGGAVMFTVRDGSLVFEVLETDIKQDENIIDQQELEGVTT